MSPHMERRRNKRHNFCTTLEFGMHRDPYNAIFKCDTANISADGLCIYVDKPLREGDELAIGTILPIPHEKAIVRWVRKIGTLYIAGLNCVS
jgi:PilZ domain